MLLENLKPLKLSKTQEKHLKLLLINHLSGNTIYENDSNSRYAYKCGQYSVDQRSRKSIQAFLRYISSSEYCNRYTTKITINIAYVLTNIENGREMLNDVLDGVVLKKESYRKSRVLNEWYKSKQEEYHAAGKAKEYWEATYHTCNGTEISKEYHRLLEVSDAALGEYREFIKQF